MKQYIKNNKIDHLKYLDYEEQSLEDKINKFNQIANHYETLLNHRRQLEEELDTLRAKFEVCR
jgi:predicted transcriptional regulator